jgi:hydroxyacylglutathione hydrolase
MKVEAIRAFDDNYIWLICDQGSLNCAVVDPGDEEPVITELGHRGLQLSAILITHKHYDHTGGIAGLKARWPDATVFGPANEPIKGIEQALKEGDTVDLPAMSVSLRVMDVPGHTEGHIAYYGDGSLFCGDTLFAAGCGRVFSGTFAQLATSLKRIRELPAETRVYCAHEYTQANIGFAAWVEPDSAAVRQRADAVATARELDQATVPSLLSDELLTNPFLRVDQANVVAAASNWAGSDLAGETEVFTALRQWKDRDYD